MRTFLGLGCVRHEHLEHALFHSVEQAVHIEAVIQVDHQHAAAMPAQMQPFERLHDKIDKQGRCLTDLRQGTCDCCLIQEFCFACATAADNLQRFACHARL